MTRWTHADIPAQNGRIALVTGTGGLGFEDALALARAGADTIIAGRNPAKGAEAVAAIRRAVPRASIRFERLDLADLASVAACAERLAASVERIDTLINNAAVMIPPERTLTTDGFELQLGTNHLGHFALTAHLLPLLRRGRAPRVVSVSSVAAPQGRIDFDDLQAEHRYVPMTSYSQSKLANLLFMLELDRRSRAGGWGMASIGAHPGVSRTNLIHNGAGENSLHGRIRTYLPFLFQPAERGALPTLYAATAPDAHGGGYYGPDGLFGVRGYPTVAKLPHQALDEEVAARLWRVSEELTGIRFGTERPAVVRHAAA
ncbi:NAD(P)-dependent dehydrogenase, short-chain alcohol dehydrogenase family [Sphingomonas guangdongensis]|uniref:NAD(P)-dependent dehydrogenase, short-chain alcohol dehydrogenase family n=1 Tax=Sphingomonas guangdongensis TaxID=1141890 RepID=A0A285QZT5_9SPHN|nr:SDR family oxidoreductase [Sphingomonas guangdongensis]SOB87376.1 NAD(P)-dependent dehydrogenase, short-chain alcohol dehydrogenase family [Sphingomonas guangdongensis]